MKEPVKINQMMHGQMGMGMLNQMNNPMMNQGMDMNQQQQQMGMMGNTQMNNPMMNQGMDMNQQNKMGMMIQNFGANNNPMVNQMNFQMMMNNNQGMNPNMGMNSMMQQQMAMNPMMMQNQMGIGMTQAAKMQNFQEQMRNILNNIQVPAAGAGNDAGAQFQQQSPQASGPGFIVIFRACGATGQYSAPIMFQCMPDDKVSDVIEKYRNYTGDRDLSKKFIFNAQSLKPSLSVAEAGLVNNANIFVETTKGVKKAYGNKLKNI